MPPDFKRCSFGGNFGVELGVPEFDGSLSSASCLLLEGEQKRSTLTPLVLEQPDNIHCNICNNHYRQTHFIFRLNNLLLFTDNYFYRLGRFLFLRAFVSFVLQGDIF